MKWIVGMFLLGFVVGQLSQDRSLELGGYRLGFGSDGWVLQSTTDWHVLAQGWFPWHKSVSDAALCCWCQPSEVAP
jgi:hypothetical protein